MEQKNLARWLKWIIAGVGVCGLIGYLSVVPGYGQSLIRRYPEFSSWYIPWFAVILLTAVPIYIAMYYAWRIADNIGKDNSFCYDNADSLRKIARLAIIDVAYFFCANIVMTFLGMNHPGVLLLSFAVDFAGVAASVFFAALSHLILKAAKMKEENDLTI